MIESVKRETVLQLFQTQKLSKIWYYIYYRSEKRRAYITGFVKVTAVEPIDNVQIKLNEGKNKLKKDEKKIKAHSIPKKESLDSKTLKNENPQIKKTTRKSGNKRISKKNPEAPKISKKNSVIVTATRANIYRKPDIKSDIIDTVEKGTILTLVQKQNLPKIWHCVSFYSKKRKVFTNGYVKFTAVERIDDTQKTIIESQKKEDIPKADKHLTTGVIDAQEGLIETRKYEEIPIADSHLIKKVDNAQEAKISKKEIHAEKMLSIKITPTEIIPSLQKISENLLSTAAPTLEINAFKKIIEPPVEIKAEQMAFLSPSPSLEVMAFHKEKAKPLFSVLSIKKLKNSKYAKEKHTQIEEFPEKQEIRVESPKTMDIQNFAKPKKVKVSAEITNVYLKPNIKGEIVEKVKKGMILTLDQKQESPKIWKYISFYSEKKKSHIKGYVKSTAVEKIDYAQISTKTASEKLKLEEKKHLTHISQAEETAISSKLEKEVSRIKKSHKEEEIKATAVKTSEIQKRISKIGGFVQDSLAETAYVDKKISKKKVSASQKLKEELKEVGEREEFKAEEDSLNTASKTKEPTASQNIKKEKIQIEESYKQKEMRPLPAKKRSHKKRSKLITLGIGYGQSYGGAGGFIQVNTKAGLAFHAGVGYFPSSLIYSETDWVKGKMLFSGGLKYYLPFKTNPIYLYLDLQYCGIGVEVAHVFSGKFYNGPLFDNVQKTLWGPSFFCGIEAKMGLIGFNGALGLSYNTTEAEWLDQNIFLTFDFGLLLYF